MTAINITKDQFYKRKFLSNIEWPGSFVIVKYIKKIMLQFEMLYVGILKLLCAN